MRSPSYLLRWDGATQTQSEAQFDDVDGLHATLDRVICEAIELQTTITADLYTSPTVMDPLLIQFTLGHPSRATLLWHFDGEIMVAQDNRLHSHGPTDAQLDQVVGVPVLGPESSLTPATVRAALVVYVLTGQRADALRWHHLVCD